jgi:hypothetical protein
MPTHTNTNATSQPDTTTYRHLEQEHKMRALCDAYADLLVVLYTRTVGSLICIWPL